MLATWKKSYDQSTQHITEYKQRHYFDEKGLSSQSYSFPVLMYGRERWTIKKSWVLNNWCFWTVVLEEMPESPLDCKDIQPVHFKGISPEYSLKGLMLKLKLQYFLPPDAKNWLIWKDRWLRQLSACLQCGRPRFNPWVGKIPWRRKWQPTPGLCLENPMDGGA